jgi:predicted transcriptional regulator
MATLTIRLPDDKHNRLKALAERRNISLNKLFEELSTQALAEFDTEVRFRTLAAQGQVARGLEILDKLDTLRMDSP